MINFNELKAEMSHKWKVQTASAKCISCVAYVDARQVQDKLDEVVGSENWTTRYETIDGQMFCHLGIYDERKKDWVWKSDTGTESMAEKEKGLVSDAFKRAAVQWGVGRFLYSKEIFRMFAKNISAKGSKFYPADDNGKQLYNDDLTKFINKKRGVTANTYAKSHSAPATNEVIETVTTSDSGKTHSDTPEGRYSKSKGGANVSYQKAHTISDETMAKVRDLKRDGMSGGDVLKSYLVKYNAEKGTEYTPANLNNDELVNAVIYFINNSAPADL